MSSYVAIKASGERGMQIKGSIGKRDCAIEGKRRKEMAGFLMMGAGGRDTIVYVKRKRERLASAGGECLCKRARVNIRGVRTEVKIRKKLKKMCEIGGKGS